VLEIGRGKVRLGFEIDKDVPVHRAEVWEHLSAGGRRAGPTGGGPLVRPSG
jgi:sRNA-binding carbon storage regulator CsrA